jgi:DNA-binding NarL/FixJ family response regulator
MGEPYCGVSIQGSENRRAAAPESGLDASAAFMRVIVGRFDPIVRPGIEQALCSTDALEVIASDVDSAALDQRVDSLNPALVILSQAVSQLVIERLKAARSRVGIVVIAYDPTPDYGWQLLATGATCVAQSTPIADLLEAVRLTGQGGRVFLDAHGERVERRPSEVLGRLTPKELQILERLSRKQPYAKIALDLAIEVETVRKYNTLIRQKLGVASSQDLIGMPVSVRNTTLNRQ